MPHFGAYIGVLIALLPLAGCHRGGPDPAPVAVEIGEIGDSTAFGARIIGFNSARNRASYMLESPAHLVWLVVVPGRTIERIGGLPADTAMTPAGIHVVPVALPRPAAEPRGEPRLVDQMDYKRCVDQRVRAATRRKPTRRVVRDSAGREISVDGPPEVEVPIDAERQAERACAGILKRATPEAPRQVERFLVLLASDVRVTPEQLQARLDATTVTASDVPTTITAIADALYFDRRAVWSGYFRRW